MKNNVNHKILIIDDDADLRDTLKLFLEDDQYQIYDCGTAAEAESLLENNHFSAIVLDIFLPDRNGLDFIQTIRDMNIQTPIVIITGSSDLEVARQALRVGVFDYIVKPFKQGQLHQILHNAIQKNYIIEEKEALENQRRVYQEELEKMVQRKVKELQESESKYRSLVEQSLVGVFITKDNVFKYVNKKTCEILQCPKENLLSDKCMLDFVFDEDKTKAESFIEFMKERSKLGHSVRVRAKTLNNEERILEIWMTKITYQGEDAYEGVMIDVTEQDKFKERERQLQMQLLNEHKMAAIGRLAAGISHNLNTPIAIIQGNAELLKLHYPQDSEVDRILKQTERMTALIQTILDKGHKEQETQLMEINLNDLLLQELEFLNANLYFKHHVKKEINLEDNLPPIKGIYSDFSQSITNIIQNAVDAVYKRETRVIRITTRRVNQHIELSIADTGHGIADEDLPKIFDPFFTTKPTEREDTNDPDAPLGTGLGLSLVYNLLTPYGVKIDVQSKIDSGTTFILQFPLNT